MLKRIVLFILLSGIGILLSAQTVTFSAAGTAAYSIAEGINPIYSKGGDLSQHAQSRMKERGILMENVSDAINNPLKITPVKYDSFGRPSITYIGEHATVVVNPITGKIVTTFPTHSKVVLRLKGK